MEPSSSSAQSILSSPDNRIAISTPGSPEPDAQPSSSSPAAVSTGGSETSRTKRFSFGDSSLSSSVSQTLKKVTSRRASNTNEVDSAVDNSSSMHDQIPPLQELITLEVEQQAHQSALEESSDEQDSTPVLFKRPDMFKDVGSMRAGTQTLVQVLSQIPWDGLDQEDGEDDSYLPARGAPAHRQEKSKRRARSADRMTSRSDPPVSNSFRRPQYVSKMTSSIHTIHRPILTSKYRSAANLSFPPNLKSDHSGSTSTAVAPTVPMNTPYTPNVTSSKQHFEFPFKDNTIARRARGPGREELEYEGLVAHSSQNSSPSGSRSPSHPSETNRLHHEEDYHQMHEVNMASSEEDQEGDEAMRIESDSEGLDDDEREEDGEDALSPPNEFLYERPRTPSSLRSSPGQSLRSASHDEFVSTFTTSPVTTTLPLPDLHPPSKSNESSSPLDASITLSSPANSRSETVGTIGRKRRKKAEKLRDIFELEDVEEVKAEFSCWLMRSILLQGYIYLTTGHICFYAHMPLKSESKIIKSGPLTRKGGRTRRSAKYWFTLKERVLSWYTSSADPYFPQGNIDLQYAIECEPVDEKSFRLRTNKRSISISADTASSRDEWVKAVRRVIFRTQHEGESIKIAIPLETIIQIDKNSSLDFAETIEIKVVEGDETTLSYDTFFFSYFADIDAALQSMHQLLEVFRPTFIPTGERLSVLDNTARRPSSKDLAEKQDEAKLSTLSVIPRLGSLLHPFTHYSTPKSTSKASSTPASTSPGGSPPRSRMRINTANSDPIDDLATPTLLDSTISVNTLTPGRPSDSPGEASGSIPISTTPTAHHTYPPTVAPGTPPSGLNSDPPSVWGVGLLKRPVKILGSGAAGAATVLKTVPTGLRSRVSGRKRAVSVLVTPEMPVTAPSSPEISTNSQTVDSFTSNDSFAISQDGSNAPMGFSLMEKSETGDKAEAELTEKFNEWFAMDEKNEHLLEHFNGYLFRVVPVPGKVFISTRYFCFKASSLLVKTKMIVPMRDIIGVQKQKAFRFGHHGLAVILTGHEEVFLEFSSRERRDVCMEMLNRQMEEVHQMVSAGIPTHDKDTVFIDELDDPLINQHRHQQSMHLRSSTNATDILPPAMFTSASSSFLDFRPKDPLHITCLTIGSRGDVQPYIALAKGLQAEGHTVRIASHGEYKDWVEGHGIEFASVGGDPAELMRICVENGMFTLSFMKEGLHKFRGWLDDLLGSSWEACQGTDLLIESPSAMGGIHIAEGLEIPYYRAFTMPWSRTRAYPHAFAVPDHKRGGSYNYMTYTMFDQVFWRAISGQINRWRRNTIGIGPTNFDKLDQHKVPFLYNFSPTVVPPPLDWYEWIRVTGYWFLDNADDSSSKKWKPPAGLEEFIDKAHEDGKKVAYIGFGSIVVSDPDAMTQCVVDAVLDADVRAIISKGWSDRLQNSNEKKEEVVFPPQIFSIGSVPHDWLFAKIDVACHHGGAGTTGASLRAGIPTLIKPFFGDQFFWADRVEALGIGSGIKKLTKEHLTAALRTATTDEKQIAKAKLIGENIRAENGVATAIQAIYRDLEYARSLVKHRAEDAHRTADSNTTTPASPRNTPLPATSDSREPHEPGSDESWSVVSDNGVSGNSPKVSSSPETSRPHSTSGIIHKTNNTGLGLISGLGSGIQAVGRASFDSARTAGAALVPSSLTRNKSVKTPVKDEFKV